MLLIIPNQMDKAISCPAMYNFPTLGLDILKFWSTRFNIQDRPCKVQDFPVVWLAAPREINSGKNVATFFQQFGVN